MPCGGDDDVWTQCGTLDFVTALKPITAESTTVADAKPPRAETMHIDADAVRRQIAAESDVDSVFSSLKTRNDATLGLVVELKTNTPIRFPDFQLLARLFWTHARQSNGTSVPDPVRIGSNWVELSQIGSDRVEWVGLGRIGSKLTSLILPVPSRPVCRSTTLRAKCTSGPCR